MKIVLVLLFSLLVSSTAVCGEWAIAKDGSATTQQDGAQLWVICDTQHGRALHPESQGKIVIFLREPNADWTIFEKIRIRTQADDGSISSPGGGSTGTALSERSLVLEDEATWELSVMGSARKTFTLQAGRFARTYSVSKLRESVSTVLEKCGDHW